MGLYFNPKRLVDCRAKKINEFIPYGIPGEVTALDLSQENYEIQIEYNQFSTSFFNQIFEKNRISVLTDTGEDSKLGRSSFTYFKM